MRRESEVIAAARAVAGLESIASELPAESPLADALGSVAGMLASAYGLADIEPRPIGTLRAARREMRDRLAEAGAPRPLDDLDERQSAIVTRGLPFTTHEIRDDVREAVAERGPQGQSKASLATACLAYGIIQGGIAAGWQR